MPELSIRFASDEKVENSPIQVSMFRPDSGTSTTPHAFTPPLANDVLKDIRWYLEIFSTWPTGPDYDRAHGIKGNLELWGTQLRDSIVSDPNAARLWQQFIDSPDQGKVITIDATDPRVLRLPWELLADNSGHLFSRRISVRRRLQENVSAHHRDFTLPVRILVIVSRPDNAGQIDARAVSLPLLDAVKELGNQIETEFLYPPTLKALSDRLADEVAPPVHVVHFDGHGVYDGELGLGYLLFEDEAHKAARVDANTLGNLLNDCGVPLMVLNACQSAAQEETNPYASVAARLIRAGVGSVVAMNYSVLVVAAHKFVDAFYGRLADGLTIARSLDRARRDLMAEPKRHTLTRRDADGNPIEEIIELSDWFLPALYQQAQDPIVFPKSSDGAAREEKPLPQALTDSTMPGGLPAEPLHGFRGRSRELLILERTLANHAVVVLHGFGGLGKTTLATEAGRWFYRTGRFPGGAAFVSFEFGGSLQQLCSWVGQAISGDNNFVLGDGDPVERIAKLLREKPALIILDNFESVLGDDPIVPPEELKLILDAVWKWGQAGVKAGRSETSAWGSRILITTRDASFSTSKAEIEFTDSRFRPSKDCAHIALGGLASYDALELASHILEDHGIDRTKVDRRGLEDLMDHLGGHPLSLYLVLPRLAMMTAATLIEHFEELLPGFASGEAKARNESLQISLEFSLKRLGEETRAALPALAVFQGVAFEDDLLDITEIDSELWKTARTNSKMLHW